MIYSNSELIGLIPALAKVPAVRITSLLEQAEGDILYFIRSKTLPVVPETDPVVYPS